jgi:hypothetical protein
LPRMPRLRIQEVKSRHCRRRPPRRAPPRLRPVRMFGSEASDGPRERGVPQVRPPKPATRSSRSQTYREAVPAGLCQTISETARNRSCQGFAHHSGTRENNCFAFVGRSHRFCSSARKETAIIFAGVMPRPARADMSNTASANMHYGAGFSVSTHHIRMQA